MFFTANRERSIDNGFYRLDYRRPGAKPVLLTRPGTTNSAMVDKTGHLAIVNTSFPGQPPQSWLSDASGKRLAWIEENRVDAAHPCTAIGRDHHQPFALEMAQRLADRHVRHRVALRQLLDLEPAAEAERAGQDVGAQAITGPDVGRTGGGGRIDGVRHGGRGFDQRTASVGAIARNFKRIETTRPRARAVLIKI